MSLFSSIQHQFHRLIGDASPRSRSPVHESPLKEWLHSSAGRSSKAKALAADLQQQLDNKGRKLDLSAHAPHLLAALPNECLRGLRPLLDHLVLPDGCEPSTVVRWAEQLALRELTAHDVRPAGGVRDRDLPASLVVVHGDADLMPHADRLITRRLLDTRRSAGASSTTDAPAARTSPQPQPTSSTPGTVQDWTAALALARRCAGAPLEGEHRALNAFEARRLLNLLQSVPTDLLPVRGRIASSLAREWLAEGAQHDLSPEQALQLEVAFHQAHLAFVLPTERGERMADAIDTQWLNQLRSWEAVGPEAQDRRSREAGFERDLTLARAQMKHHYAATSTAKTLQTLRAGPSSTAQALAKRAGPTQADAPPTRATPIRPRRVWEENEAGYMALHTLPPLVKPAAAAPVYDTLPAGPARRAPGILLRSLPPVKERATVQEEGVYDTPPLRKHSPGTAAASGPTAVPRSPLGKAEALVTRPAGPAPGRLTVGDLERARAQLAPFFQWLKHSGAEPNGRMKVSPLQLAPLGSLLASARSMPALSAQDAQALMAGSWVVERVSSGKISSMSRADVSLLADAVSALRRLPADESAPALPPQRSIRTPATV